MNYQQSERPSPTANSSGSVKTIPEPTRQSGFKINGMESLITKHGPSHIPQRSSFNINLSPTPLESQLNEKLKENLKLRQVCAQLQNELGNEKDDKDQLQKELNEATKAAEAACWIAKSYQREMDDLKHSAHESDDATISHRSDKIENDVDLRIEQPMIVSLNHNHIAVSPAKTSVKNNFDNSSISKLNLTEAFNEREKTFLNSQKEKSDICENLDEPYDINKLIESNAILRKSLREKEIQIEKVQKDHFEIEQTFKKTYFADINRQQEEKMHIEQELQNTTSELKAQKQLHEELSYAFDVVQDAFNEALNHMTFSPRGEMTKIDELRPCTQFSYLHSIYHSPMSDAAEQPNNYVDSMPTLQSSLASPVRAADSNRKHCVEFFKDDSRHLVNELQKQVSSLRGRIRHLEKDVLLRYPPSLPSPNRLGNSFDNIRSGDMLNNDQVYFPGIPIHQASSQAGKVNADHSKFLSHSASFDSAEEIGRTVSHTRSGSGGHIHNGTVPLSAYKAMKRYKPPTSQLPVLSHSRPSNYSEPLQSRHPEHSNPRVKYNRNISASLNKNQSLKLRYLSKTLNRVPNVTNDGHLPATNLMNM